MWGLVCVYESSVESTNMSRTIDGGENSTDDSLPDKHLLWNILSYELYIYSSDASWKAQGKVYKRKTSITRLGTIHYCRRDLDSGLPCLWRHARLTPKLYLYGLYTLEPTKYSMPVEDKALGLFQEQLCSEL